MPKSSVHPPDAKPDRNVLLVEEYDALATAIRSALEKFAPGAVVHVAPSFVGATSSAVEVSPTLLVVDFDPPQMGAVAFFDNMQVAHPDARLLVLASGTAREITAIRGSTGAIQFLEKPFELAEFGAAVQALLGPWRDAGIASRGTLRDLSLGDLLPLACLASATTEIKLRGDRDGHVHLRRGNIVHASCGSLVGAAALEEMLTWRNVRFSETPGLRSSAYTIDGPWSNVLSKALERATPRMPARSQPRVEAKPERPKTGKKMVIIDDTEMLLIFVEDTLAQTDPGLQITTAATGTSGVAEAERVIPDLVLLDYSLPDILGDEVCKRLLANKRTCRVPIVMMSGHVPEMMSVATRFPNVVRTIAKPFRSEALIRVVAEALEKGRLPVIPPSTIPHEEPTAKPAPPMVSRQAQATVAVPETVVAIEAAAPAAPPILPRAPAPTAPVPILETEILPETKAPPPLPPSAAAPPRPAFTPPAPSPPLPQISQPAPFSPPPAPVTAPTPALTAKPPRNDAGVSETRVLLALPLQISAMQFTSAFQIASVRARPATTGVSLRLVGSSSLAALPVKKRFHLGLVTLDAAGHLDTVCLDTGATTYEQKSTASSPGGPQPASLSEDAGYFAPGISQPMTMQLLIPLDLAAIQLSSFFEIAQLVLKCHGSAVRGTLDGYNGAGESGATFRVSAVRLDTTQRIAELALMPVNERTSGL